MPLPSGRRTRTPSATAVVVAVSGLLAGCPSPGPNVSDDPPPPVVTPSEPAFVERARELGIDFTHYNGMSGRLHFCEMMGAGAAVFDHDRDGDLDVYLVQGADLDADATPTYPPPSSQPLDRLYRNDLTIADDGTPTLRFTDITAEAGLASDGYGMGVATGDYDNDGRTDLYVTNFGANQLWRSEPDGTYRDATAESGTGDPRWSTSAAFADFDRDGWLDLFVVNYVDYSVSRPVPCHDSFGRPSYCGPLAFEPVADRLYRNRGDGTFEDASHLLGGGPPPATGLGVVAADLDGDGALDFYVANDSMPNHAWMAQPDGTFRDGALLAGVAVNASGTVEASMGVEAEDIDDDGDLDLFMTHLDGETNTLYTNSGSGFFEDRTDRGRLGGPSLVMTGFGTAMFDYDLDGHLDLAITNGAVKALEDLLNAGDPYPLDQPDQLFRNTGAGHFEDVSATAGAGFTRATVGRGLAVGDLDNDGDPDLVVNDSTGPARVLINQLASDRPWIGLQVTGTPAGRDMLGAVVDVLHVGGRRQRRLVRTDGSYCSARDPRVLVGLGETEGVDAIHVTWPSGRVEKWPAALDRYGTLVEGDGTPMTAPVPQ